MKLQGSFDEDLVGSATSVEEIIGALDRRGCPNLTLSIDLAACSDFPHSAKVFFDVFQGTLHGGTRITIKCLRICDWSEEKVESDKQNIFKRAAGELYRWSKLQHRNVLPLLGLAFFRGYISLIFERMENGNLSFYLTRNTSVDRLKLCMDVCAGLCYIHTNEMVHGDLKAANIMVSLDGTALIADLGSARLKDLTRKQTNMTNRCFSVRWAAPELLLEDSDTQASEEADVYAYGMTALEVLTGEVPYKGLNDNQVTNLVICEQKSPSRPDIGIHDDLWNILSSCWNRNPSERPGIMSVSDYFQAMFRPVTGPWDKRYRASIGGRLKADWSRDDLTEQELKQEPDRFGAYYMPQGAIRKVNQPERLHQDAINEIIRTERDFVRDLEYLRNRWIDPLRTESIIPSERQADFVQQVFGNIEDILDLNTRLRDLLVERQQAHPVVQTIGDLFLELVPRFQLFVQYGKHYPYSKHTFKREKSTNPAFAAFVETIENLPESRRLKLHEFLIKPVVRFAWYPLLLEVVLKYTPEGNADRVTIPKVVKMARELLGEMHYESSGSEDRLKLSRLSKMLEPKQSQKAGLEDQQRQLVYKGVLKRRVPRRTIIDLQVFLLDHALLMIEGKAPHDNYVKVFKRIPLELLSVSLPGKNDVRSPGPSKASKAYGYDWDDWEHTGYQLKISHLGKEGCSLELWAPTLVTRQKWLEQITSQQDALRKRSAVFDIITLNNGVFVGKAKVNCAVPYDHGRRIAYGTDAGVYFQSLHGGQNRAPVKVLDLADVQQIDVLEGHQLLIVLSERSVLTFPINVPDSTDPMKLMKRISSHTSFYRVGYCLGRTLVCLVKASSSWDTVKMFEPVDQSLPEKHKSVLQRLLHGPDGTLKLFKEFRIPPGSRSIHVLKTTLCVAYTTHFDAIKPEAMLIMSLLNSEDASLEFMQAYRNVRPLSIYRIDDEFLLCYVEFAFYVNKEGLKSKKDVTIYWEGTPTSFAIHHPYVMAFDPTFVEIRHIDDGSLVQIIPGNNIRLLSADNQRSVMNSTGTLQPGEGQSSQHKSYSSGQGLFDHCGASMSAERLYHMQQVACEQDGILLASDDKILSIRLAAPPPYTADVPAPQALQYA